MEATLHEATLTAVRSSAPALSRHLVVSERSVMRGAAKVRVSSETAMMRVSDMPDFVGDSEVARTTFSLCVSADGSLVQRNSVVASSDDSGDEWVATAGGGFARVPPRARDDSQRPRCEWYVGGFERDAQAVGGAR